MGRIFEQFGNLAFQNEAEVSERLVIPLLTEFLGYSRNEILPEHLQPAVKIPRNRDIALEGDDAKIKPDYMVALDGDPRQVAFSLDSKGPNESLDDYLTQLIAYCISVGRNLVATTNGTEFRVYDANDLVFRAVDIEALDLQFSELRKLLHKQVVHIPLAERIRSLDDNLAQGRDIEIIANEQRRRVAVQNNDFRSYLQIVADSTDTSTLPTSITEAFQVPLQRFPPQDLYTFFNLGTEHPRGEATLRSYDQVIQEISTTSMVIVGESGAGKSSLLAEITREFAGACLRNESIRIPVLVRLSLYTSSNNLIALVANQLGRGNERITPQETIELMRQGRLVLLLDAFDEVIDTYLHDLQTELESFLRDYRCSVVITTRPFRDPQLPLVVKYRLQSLTAPKIRAFSKMYLGEEYQAFLGELERKHLGNLASNTLLLTLLILLYSTNRDLPQSRTQVMHAVVAQLETWTRSKNRRFQHLLSWQQRLELLSELAFLSFIESDSYTLHAERANQAVAQKLDAWQAARTIDRDMTLDEAYAQLEDTGLIHKQESGISFWHRAFQEYLAALEIAKRIGSGNIRINDYIRDPKWESILPSVAFLADSREALISDLLALNIFTAAKALVECGVESGTAYERTVDCLGRKCESRQRAIRQIAVDLLKQIGGEYAGTKFHDLLESDYLKQDNQFEHIRKIALVEIARRKIPNARQIVYTHLNWHGYTNMEWMNEELHAGATVIEALSWLDDAESHRYIVDNWIARGDMPTRDTCRDAVARIGDRGTLDESAKRVLFEWFVGHQANNRIRANVVPAERSGENDVDYWGVRTALIAMHDVDLALRLVAQLALAEDRMQASCIKDVLKTFSEPQVVQALVQQAKTLRDDPVLSARFVDVLSEIEGQVPIDVFWEFARDERPSAAKVYGIRGLGSLPFNQIESTILAALHPPSYERLVELKNEYLIGQVARAYSDAETNRILAEFASLPSLDDTARTYLQQLLARTPNTPDVLRQLAGAGTPPAIRRSIYENSQHISSGKLREAIPSLLDSDPIEHLLTTDPYNYPQVQEEGFRVLGKYGKIALLAKPENRLPFLYNTSSETLFRLIRRDKVYEMEPFISSWIDERESTRDGPRKRMVIDAVWVLAELGNVSRAQEVVDRILTNLDHAERESDWVLGDILEGIHLLPAEHALAQIERIWSSRSQIGSILVPSYCIQALAQIGTRQALDMLARIVQETLAESNSLIPEEALRAMLFVSPVGREQWLIELLQQEPSDRAAVQRAIEMLGMTGNPAALPTLERYLASHPVDRIGYFAFWALQNVHKANRDVWYNGEEVGCI